MASTNRRPFFRSDNLGIVKMKTLILAILLATATLAQAQQPRTIKLHNNATGENIGSVTISGNTSYLRDKNGEHVATIVRNPDGSKTSFDPSGNVIESVKLPK
jgi:hypothetical protein